MMKLFLRAIAGAETSAIEVRSEVNRALLVTIGREGLYLFERRANSRHVLSWEELRRVEQALRAGEEIGEGAKQEA